MCTRTFACDRVETSSILYLIGPVRTGFSRVDFLADFMLLVQALLSSNNKSFFHLKLRKQNLR